MAADEADRIERLIAATALGRDTPIYVNPHDYRKIVGELLREPPVPSMGGVIPIVPSEGVAPGDAYVVTKKAFDPFDFKFEPALPQALFYITACVRPLPLRSMLFFPYIDDGHIPRKRKVSRRQQKREKLRALFYRKHSTRCKPYGERA